MNLPPLDDKTDYQIQQLGFQALVKALGVAGFIRFWQQFEKGSGDYVIDREAWQKDYTVELLAKAILEKKGEHF